MILAETLNRYWAALIVILSRLVPVSTPLVRTSDMACVLQLATTTV